MDIQPFAFVGNKFVVTQMKHCSITTYRLMKYITKTLSYFVSKLLIQFRQVSRGILRVAIQRYVICSSFFHILPPKYSWDMPRFYYHSLRWIMRSCTQNNNCSTALHVTGKFCFRKYDSKLSITDR